SRSVTSSSGCRGQGMRRGAVRDLRWQDIDRKAGTLRLPAEIEKTRRSRGLPLPPELLAILDRRWAARTGLTRLQAGHDRARRFGQLLAAGRCRRSCSRRGRHSGGFMSSSGASLWPRSARAIAVDAPLVAALSGLETMSLSDVTWRPLRLDVA